MEGVSFAHRGNNNKSSSLRRMQSEVQLGSSRSSGPLGSSRLGSSRDSPSSRFWSTVMNSNPSASPQQPTFQSAFTTGGASSSGHIQPMPTFHGSTTASSSRSSTSRQSSSASRRYTCNDCGTTYSTAKEWTSHREKHHLNTKPYKCDHCPLSFSQRSHLNQHVKTVHEKVKPHKCPDCPRSFGKKYDLSSHRDAVHIQNKPHSCDVCHRRFAKRSNLTRHIDKLHPERRDYPSHR